MTLVAFSPSRSTLPLDLHPFERLAVSLSACFSTLEVDDVDEQMARALEETGVAFAADECTLVAYGEHGAVSVVGSWATAPHAPCRDQDLPEMPWLLRRVSRNTVVAVTPTTDFPQAAASDRAHAAQTGLRARLAVPVALGTRVGYGLILGSRDRHGDWPAPVIERLRLVGEILGGGLERLRQSRALQEGRTTATGGRGVSSADAPQEGPNRPDLDQIVGESAVFRLALARIGQVAPLDATVLLLGETGTGKELFAAALHERSRRHDRPLVRVNCAALPATLIESELFGHERGAFTGAVSMRQGRFELADRGTIFLDEIGDLAPELQAKMLRVLQEGEFERVGSSKPRRVDVRVIAATHVDLEQAVADGRFRADLYYRLGVFPIRLPPLRERVEDIPPLVWFFIHRYQRRMGRLISRVPDAVMESLQRYEWPGNVRELENVIERAMIRATDGTLHLDDRLHAGGQRSHSVANGDTLDAVQRLHIEKVLCECGGRINGAGNAAVRLGLHPNTLRFRMKKLGVMRPAGRAVSFT